MTDTDVTDDDAFSDNELSDFGLDHNGHRAIPVGNATGRLSLWDGGRVTLLWDHQGARMARPPSTVSQTHPGEIADARRIAAELRTAVADECDRVEDLLTQHRRWSFEAWRRRYLDHPVARVVARRLLWTFTPPSTLSSRSVTLMPIDGELRAMDGTVVPIDDQWRVRLWHPLLADPDETHAWRVFHLHRFCQSSTLRQPFRQILRDTHTPDHTEAAASSSARFGGRILHYREAAAALKQRRWSVPRARRGAYETSKDLPGYALRARVHVFRLTGRDEDHLRVIGPVHFERTDSAEPVTLEQLPPLVFSEVMRDVEQVADAASFTADLSWDGRPSHRLHESWRRAAFAAPGPPALVRRDVITRVRPAMRVGSELAITDDSLLVTLWRRRFRICITSGVAVRDPDGDVVAVTPSKRALKEAAGHVPFDDDPVLHRVLATAIALADDYRLAS